MGAILGKALGTIGGALVGGLFDNSRAKRKRQNEIDDIRLKGKRIRESAERGGFNPVTMLGATGGAGFMPSSGVPPLSSVDAFMQAGSQLGALADERAREEEKKAEAAERVREINAVPGGASVVQTGTQGRRVPGRTTINGSEVYSLNEGAAQARGAFNYPQDMNEENTNFKMDPGYRHDYQGPLLQSFQMSDGTVVEVPVGPDLDEMLTGFGMEKVHQFNKATDDWWNTTNFNPGNWSKPAVMPPLTDDEWRNAPRYQ